MTARDGPDRAPGPWYVLIVDDQEHVRTVLRRYLAHAGHDVATAAGAPEALSLIETRAPDLVLLDRAMPEISVDRLVTLIRDRAPATRIVVLSGFGTSSAPQESISAVDGMLAKPVALQELLTALTRIMATPAADPHGRTDPTT